MKRYCLLSFVCFSLNVGIAQKIFVGFKAGLNSSIFSASINSEASFKSGLHVGLYGKSPINEKLFFRPEIYYSSQGQKDDYDSNSGSTTTKVNYLNIPLLLELGKKVTFQFGPQMGFLLSASEKGTINGKAVDEDIKEAMRKSPELAFLVGVGANLGERLNIGIRLNKGISSIFLEKEIAPGITMPKVQNNVFHFYIGGLLGPNK